MSDTSKAMSDCVNVRVPLVMALRAPVVEVPMIDVAFLRASEIDLRLLFTMVTTVRLRVDPTELTACTAGKLTPERRYWDGVEYEIWDYIPMAASLVLREAARAVRASEMVPTAVVCLCSRMGTADTAVLRPTAQMAATLKNFMIEKLYQTILVMFLDYGEIRDSVIRLLDTSNEVGKLTAL
jgi:hypothetical protein